MDKLLWIVPAFVAGSLLPIQAGVNAKLGRAAESPIMAILIFGLLWLGGILITAVLGNLLLDVHLIANFSSWEPFESRWLGWINGIQLGAGLLAITLLLFYRDMRDEYFMIFNPLMDFAMISVFYAVFCPVAFLILWLLDLALVRFF